MLSSKTVSADGDILLQAYSRITQTPQGSQAEGSASTLVDVQGTLLSKGLVTLEARSWVDLQVVSSGTSADLALKAVADATARLGASSAVTGAGLRVSASTDVRVVAELSGATAGTLDLQATQSSVASVLGGSVITIAAKNGDTAPQVLVEASGTTQLRGVVGVQGTEAEDLVNPAVVSGKIVLDRVVRAQVGDGSLGSDGRHGAAVKGVGAGDDAIALGLADLVEIGAHRLDAAFQRLGAGICEEHRVGEGGVGQPFGQPLLPRNAEDVRGMPELAALLDQGVHQTGMGMAQGRDGDSGGEIEISAAVLRKQIRAFAPFKGEIDPGIDG